MTKSELIKKLSIKYDDLYLKDITLLVDVILEQIAESLENGRRVELRGFGSFSIRERKPRTARNPKTGNIVHLGSRNSVYFRAGKELKESVNSRS